MAMKKGKGHSTKARHHTGIPAAGKGVKRGGKAVKVEVGRCLCGQPLRYVQLVGGTGKQKYVWWCHSCGVEW